MRRWLSLAALLVIAVPAAAQQRTWTIARDVYTVDGELMAVRGDTAYLRIGDRVESVPLARLSAIDHEFIGSLALAPVTPGPAGENPLAEQLSGPVISGPSGDILPVAAEEHSLVVPASGTIAPGPASASAAVGEESLPHPATTVGPTPTMVPPHEENWYPPTNYRNRNTYPPGANPPNANRRPPDPEAERRFWRQQQQQQQQRQQNNNRNANSNRNNDRDKDDDDSRGVRGRLFGRDR